MRNSKETGGAAMKLRRLYGRRILIPHLQTMQILHPNSGLVYSRMSLYEQGIGPFALASVRG